MLFFAVRCTALHSGRLSPINLVASAFGRRKYLLTLQPHANTKMHIMEKQLSYEEWFLQSDYDLDVADSMLKTGRNIYCIYMCHLSLEKALKGLYIKRFNKIPPKLHNLLYFVEKITLNLPEDIKVF
jgi:hypothetical protein